MNKLVRKVFAIITTTAVILSLSIPAFATEYLTVGGKTFSDVPTTHWAYQSLKKGVENGVMIGFPDSTLRPDDSVTREQWFTMFFRVMFPGKDPKSDELKKMIDDYESKQPFNDLYQGTWSYEYMAVAFRTFALDQAFGENEAAPHIIHNYSTYNPAGAMYRFEVPISITSLMDTPQTRIPVCIRQISLGISHPLATGLSSINTIRFVQPSAYPISIDVALPI